MRGAKAISIATLAMLGMFPASLRAQACQLCAAAPSAVKEPARPLKIDIETEIDFATAAHTDAGRGSITLDPRTGQRSFSGLVGLSGSALRGTVTITGEPFRRIVVDLPTTITLNSTRGAKAEVTDVRTDLPATPVIGASGTLVFVFGGKLTVQNGASGDFRGRIQIRADYQ